MWVQAPHSHSLDRRIIAIGWRLQQPDEPLPRLLLRSSGR
ncbi:hypothetical protein SynRS9902_01488 [Synechococcus sp. RS9902]|nr:hypothetical protein SynRS9902_01488 [Synechococcus sp. RS9902]